MDCDVNHHKQCTCLKRVGMTVEARNNHIAWTPYVVHSLNLALKGIGTIPWIEEVYDARRDIEMFVTNHDQAHETFNTYSCLAFLNIAQT